MTIDQKPIDDPAAERPSLGQAPVAEATSDERPLPDYEVENEEEWEDEPEQIHRRPRRKLLSPVPLALTAVMLILAGFLVGVEVQKGQASSSSAAGAPAGIAALRSAGTGGGAAAGAFAGAGGGAGGGATAGQVSYVSGNTLYVATRQGNTVKVTATTGTKVTKPASTNVQNIHPGDTVVVTGSQGTGGNVTASSIAIGSSATGSAGSGSSPSGSGAAQPLFGSG